MADLSPVMLNQVLETSLALMILLLALSVSAIVRLGPTSGTSTEPAADGDRAATSAGPVPARPATALWAGPQTVGLIAPMPATRKPGWLGRGRYEARHVRGRMPKPQVAGPGGPPWGPAAPPPGRVQQAPPERWI